MQELLSKTPKPPQFFRRSARIALWLLPLVVSIYLFYQANVLAEAVGCQLGETCMTGDGAKATNYAFAAFVVLLGFVIFLIILLTWKIFKFILTKIRIKPKSTPNKIYN